MRPIFAKSPMMALVLFAGCFSAPAHAAGKSPAPVYDFTFESRNVAWNGVTLTYPKIDVKGSNLPQAEIERMISAETALSERLSIARTFTATVIDIPSVQFSVRKDKTQGDLSCTGFKFEKISSGKIGKSTWTGCSGRLGDATGTFLTLATGPGMVGDYNFVHSYRLWADKAGPDDKDAVALYGTSDIKGFDLSFSAPDAQLTLKAERQTESAGPKIKLPSQPIEGIVQTTLALTDSGSASNTEQKNYDDLKKKVLTEASSVFFEMVENYMAATCVVENYSFSSRNPKAGSESSDAFDIRISRIETQGFDRTASNITFSGATDTGKLASVTWKGFSATPLLTELRRFLNPPEAQKDQTSGIYAQPLQMFQQSAGRIMFAVYADFGTLSAQDLDMTISGITNPAAERQGPEDSRIAFRTLMLRANTPLNGRPSAVRIAVENLQLPASIALNPGQDARMAEKVAEASRGLKQVGLDPMNVSIAIDGKYDEKAGTLIVNEYSASLAGFFGYSLKGTFRNATSDLFFSSSATYEQALVKLTATDLSLHIEDTGGIGKMLAIAAKSRGVTPQELKAIFPVMVATIPQPYAGMKPVQSIRKAVLDFWENPGKLDIAVKAKSANGIGLADFIAAEQNPQSINEKLDVTAAATK